MCTDGCPTLLYYDIKEARKRCRDAGNVEGALPWLGPHTICIGTLTLCCLRVICARHRTVLATILELAYNLWRSSHLLFETRTRMRRSRTCAVAVTRAVSRLCAKYLPLLAVSLSETLVCRIQGPCEALVVILGGSETSDECSFAWYRRERAVLTFLLTISTTTSGCSRDSGTRTRRWGLPLSSVA